MNLLECIYKSFCSSRMKTHWSYRLSYQILYTYQNAWSGVVATSNVLFTYDPFKTYGSFKWTNDVEVESANLDTFLKEEFIEMSFNLKTKSMYTFKGIGYY